MQRERWSVLVLVSAVLAGAPGAARAHEVSVRGGPVDVRGAEYDQWFGDGEPMAAVSVQGGYSLAANVTLTGGWTLTGVRRTVDVETASFDSSSDATGESGGSSWYSTDEVELSLTLHRVQVGLKLQRPVTRVFWPFVEVQGVVDVAVAGFDARQDEEEDGEVRREVGASPGVFLGGGLELVGGPRPDPGREADVRRPALGYTVRLGYVLMAPYSWAELGEIPAGGVEFLQGMVVHF